MPNFSEEQQKAIDHVDGNMVVVSAAGSGKTTVIVNRVKKLIDSGVNPNKILCITFSKKAKDNMSNRLSELTESSSKVNIETFHSLGLKIIKEEHPYKIDVYTNNYDKQKVIRSLFDKNIKEELMSFNVTNFLFWIGTCKNKMYSYTDKFSIEADEDLNGIIKSHKNMAYSLWRQYEEYKKERNLIEFDDMVSMAVSYLQDEDTRNKWSNKYQYILADEYQDTSMNRALLIKLLSCNSKDVFVVGDALQCIFGFTGADNKSIMEFDKDYNAEVINMDTNYRSSKNIIALANKFAKTMEDSKHRNYKPIKAFKPRGEKPKYTRYRTEQDEAEMIALQIRQDIDAGEIKADDVAILSRTNAQLARLQIALFKQGIKFTLVDGTGFTALRETRFILNYMRLALNPHNDFAFAQVFNAPPRYLDKVFLAELKEVAAKNNKSLYGAMDLHPQYSRFKKGILKLKDVIEHLQEANYDNAGDYVKHIRGIYEGNTTYEDYLMKESDVKAQEEIHDNLDMLESICTDFGSLSDCLQYFNNMSNQYYKEDNDDPTDKVSLMSLHKSKGLEFPRVYIIGMNEDVFPHAKNKDVESEKRLFYVGITRAKDDLRLSSCGLYRTKNCDESEFITVIQDSLEIVDAYEEEDNKEDNEREG